MRRTYSVTVIKSTVPRLSNAMRSSQRSAKFYSDADRYGAEIRILLRLQAVSGQIDKLSLPMPAHGLKFSRVHGAEVGILPRR